MLRVNLFLVLILILCALATVTSQHRSRKLFQAIEAEQQLARGLDVEHDQLLIEQSTWAVHTRIEQVATQRLKMRRPEESAILRPQARPAAGQAQSGERGRQ